MRKYLLGVSVLPALLVMPTFAGAPNTSSENPAWVFGDISLNGATVRNAAVGGRRMNNWDGTKYQNDFPKYNMVGRSLSVTGSEVYVGPVTLTLRELDNNDVFAYNYQWDTDPEQSGYEDVDIADWAGIGWDEDFSTVYGKLAAKINPDPSDPNYYDNAADTVGGVYMYSRRDNNQDAGLMAFDNTNVTVNGTTVNADAISITSGSIITFVNQDTVTLTDFNGGDIDSDGVTTLNTRTMNVNGSRLVVDSGAELTLNATDGATFQNGSTNADGGAILNMGTLTLNNASFLNNEARYGGAIENVGTEEVQAQLIINGGSFENNSAQSGGAIDNDNAFLKVDGATFNGNSSARSGGAIYAQSATISNSDFTGNSAGGLGGAILSNHALTITGGRFEGNHAAAAGVLYDNSLHKTVHSVTINGTEFVDNYAGDFGAVAIFSADSSVTNATFTGNRATADYANLGDGAGALFLGSESQTVVSGSTFRDNYSGTIGGAIATRPINYWLETDYSDKGTNDSSGAKVDILSSTFEDNTAGTRGGALFNSFYNSENENGAAYVADSIFTGNSANLGGAIYNEGWQDAVGNYANIYIKDSSFTGNIAVENGGAIYNDSTMTIVAEKTGVTFSGNKANGVDNDIYNAGFLTLNAASGKSITLGGGIDGASGTLNITGTGLVVTSTIKNQLVTVSNGELHLTDGAADGSNLDGSALTIASGATINTIDNLINDYMSNARITLADGASIKGDIDFANALADMYAANTGAIVKYSVGNFIGSVGTESKEIQVVSDGATVDISEAQFTSSNGVAFVSSEAADGRMIVQGFEGGISNAVDTSATVNNIDYVLTEDESLNSDKTIQNNFVLNGDGTEAVDKGLTLNANLGIEDAVLEINDLKLAGTGSLNNAVSGILRINNSKVDIDVDNDGILISDPTIYSALVDNSGFASFDGDSFTNTSTLANTGSVNLLNGVTFENGATITGNGVTNLASGVTHFNDTVSANTITISNGAVFDGTLVSTGTVDTRNGGIDTGLGTVSGGALFVDADLIANQLDGFASTVGGAQIKKINLINSEYGTAETATLNLGGATLASDATFSGGYYTHMSENGGVITFSDKLVNTSGLYEKLGSWSGGTYIKSSTGYNQGADSDHMTVGQALSALDSQVTTLNGDSATPGSVDYKIANATIEQSQVNGLGDALDAKQDNLTAGSGINLSGSTISVANNSVTSGMIQDGTITNADIANGTITTAKLANQTVSQFTNDANYQTSSDVDSKISTALGSYSTTEEMNTAISTALSSYSTTTEMNTAIGNAITNAVGENGAVTNAITTAVNNTLGTVHGLVTSENNTKTLHETDNATNSTNVVSGEYKGNLAVGTTVEDHLIALDNAIGTISTLGGEGSALDGTKSVADNLQNLDTAVATEKTRATAAEAALDNRVTSAETTIGSHTSALSLLNGDVDTAGSVANTAANAAANAVATAAAYTDSQLSLARDATLADANAYTDQRVESLDKNLSAGIAGAVALSSVAVSGVERGEVSVGAGYGYFNGQSAAAVGAAMGLSNRWSVNAGAGISNADVSFRAGTNYKFKLF